MSGESDEVRPYVTLSTHSAPAGASTATIECPFCRAVVVARLWSLAGRGKKCSCGAVLGSYGQARKK